MVLVLGLFLLNTMCAIVPCQRLYKPPEPIKISPYLEQDDPSEYKARRHIDPIVQTETGKVRGFPMKTIGARNIFAFTGIPYAEPPVGNMRYRVRRYFES